MVAFCSRSAYVVPPLASNMVRKLRRTRLPLCRTIAPLNPALGPLVMFDSMPSGGTCAMIHDRLKGGISLDPIATGS